MSWRHRELRKLWRQRDRLMKYLNPEWPRREKVNFVDRVAKRMMNGKDSNKLRLVMSYFSKKELKRCVPSQ